ncbi:MAG: pentapeptide repeat-containing protein [Acetobacteraceae bacterium]|nr:pentapeptide repeat-containing protein [Acetobacteraceae bacterium]
MPPKTPTASNAPPCRAAQAKPAVIPRRNPLTTACSRKSPGPVGGVRRTFYTAAVRAPISPARLGLLVLLLGLAATPALGAACTAPPGPGVDWRRCLLEGRELSGADLTGATLRDAALDRARLAGAVLRGVNGRDARFVSADLTGADLEGAILRESDFTRAELAGAKLVRADLRRARLFRANLANADLTGALLDGADLLNATLDGARWTDGKRICAVGSVGVCQ